MDRSLHFYRDLLGFHVTLDHEEKMGGGRSALVPDPQRTERRAVYLRWEDEPDSTFLVLTHPPSRPSEPLKFDQLGVHHFSFWVSGLQEIFAKLEADGVSILSPPRPTDTLLYGEKPGGQVLTSLFQDPDGNIVQLDERVPV